MSSCIECVWRACGRGCGCGGKCNHNDPTTFFIDVLPSTTNIHTNPRTAPSPWLTGTGSTVSWKGKIDTDRRFACRGGRACCCSRPSDVSTSNPPSAGPSFSSSAPAPAAEGAAGSERRLAELTLRGSSSFWFPLSRRPPASSAVGARAAAAAAGAARAYVCLLGPAPRSRLIQRGQPSTARTATMGTMPTCVAVFEVCTVGFEEMIRGWDWDVTRMEGYECVPWQRRRRRCRARRRPGSGRRGWRRCRSWKVGDDGGGYVHVMVSLEHGGGVGGWTGRWGEGAHQKWSPCSQGPALAPQYSSLFVCSYEVGSRSINQAGWWMDVHPQSK